MPRSNETEYVLSVYKQFQHRFVRDYLDDIPEENEIEDISITTKRAIKKAITPLPKDSATLAVLRMKIFEEYRDSLANGNAICLVPDNFEAKLHQFPPQLVVALGEVLSNGVTSAKWTFCIPHYRHNQPTPIPSIPKLRKGSYWSRLVLLDNSRIYINAESITEGEQFIKNIVPLIDPLFVPDNYVDSIVSGKRGGQPLREVLTQPLYCAYYKKPLKNDKGKFDPRSNPDWTTIVKVKE